MVFVLGLVFILTGFTEIAEATSSGNMFLFETPLSLKLCMLKPTKLKPTLRSYVGPKPLVYFQQ